MELHVVTKLKKSSLETCLNTCTDYITFFTQTKDDSLNNLLLVLKALNKFQNYTVNQK